MNRPRTHHEHTHVDTAATELIHLWPALADALEADQGGGTDGRGTTSVFRIPVNHDVLDVIRLLTIDIPRQNHVARRLLHTNHATDKRLNMLAEITAITSLHAELEQRLPDNATQYATVVYRWERDARRAIGLTREPTPIGKDCPWHRNDRTPLQLLGAQANLDPTALDGRREAVTWNKRDTIYCPTCRRTWLEPLWHHLGRQIRLVEETETNAAMGESPA